MTRSRWARRSVVGLLLLMPSVAQAQTPADASTPSAGRLTVRPREMATGMRTERAGEFRLTPPAIDWTDTEQMPDTAAVYVPQLCVGTRRCPLLLFVWRDWDEIMAYVRPMADKYGIILLGPGTNYNALTFSATGNTQELQHLDTTLKQVLQQFAIDPDKIAFAGTCATGSAPLTIGGRNLHVFSRLVSLSPGSSPVLDAIDPPNQTTELLFEASIDESDGTFPAAQNLRQRGYRVTHAFGFAPHGHQLEGYDYVGRWLQQTWASPDPTTRPAPSVVDPLPLLTNDILTRMTAFWTRFVHEPDSIRMTGRQARLRDVIVPVGQERSVVAMVDMAALAAAYPSVAADLKAAGLTAEQHDTYRVALASARALKNSAGKDVVAGSHAGQDVIRSLDPASVQAKNLAFMDAHLDEFQALEGASEGLIRSEPANMWRMP